MQRLRVFTVADGRVEVGATIGTLQLKGAGISIPAIIIGEEGRGREQGVVPVANPPQVPCSGQGKSLYTSGEFCPKCSVPLVPEAGEGFDKKRLHPREGLVVGELMFAEIGKTKAGKPKFISASSADTDDRIIVVFRTPIGYRGSNSHTGDRTGEVRKDPWDGDVTVFHPFPGEIIIGGHLAQGLAGRAGSGEQLVAIIPKGVVFRTGYSGRRYGGHLAHYYLWDGQRLLAATWEERAASDIF